jgi:hypothetical protein
MLKQFSLALGRGLAMLVAVYLPTFVLVSAIVVSVISGADGKPPALEAAIPLIIGVSLGMALILNGDCRWAAVPILWVSSCRGQGALAEALNDAVEY